MDRRQELRGTAGALVLFGALVFGGMLAAYAAVSDYAKARASADWPATDGVILSTDSDNKVRYAWFTGGRSHSGERVRFWTAALTPSGVSYGAGSTVKVHVSPDDGAIAVLEPGGSPIVFALVLGFGGFLVFIGLAGVIRLAMKLDGLTPPRRRRASDYAAAE